MPTVLRIGSIRFHFYSDEAHIHVETPDGECKYWLSPVLLARNNGVPPHRLRELEKLVFEYEELFNRRFYEFHGNR